MPSPCLKLCRSIHSAACRELINELMVLVQGARHEQIIGAAVVAMTADRTFEHVVAGTLRHDPSRAAAGLRRLADDLQWDDRIG